MNEVSPVNTPSLPVTPSVAGPAKNSQASQEFSVDAPAIDRREARRGRVVKRAFRVSLSGMTAVTAVIAVSKAMVYAPALSRAPAPPWVTSLQTEVNQFATTLGISPPRVFPHHADFFGSIAEVWPYYGLRLVAVHDSVPLLFDNEQMRCMMAHEVSHLCQAGRSDCALPANFVPSSFFSPIDDRELEADHLGALLCGRDTMQRWLVRLAEVHQPQGLLARIRHNDATSTPKDPSIPGDSGTYPSLARRLHILRASNATYYAGPQPGPQGQENTLLQGAVTSMKRGLGIGAAYLGYRWYRSAQTSAA